MLVAHLILLGKLFHKTAVDVSNSLFPYRTVLLRFGTSDKGLKHVLRWPWVDEDVGYTDKDGHPQTESQGCFIQMCIHRLSFYRDQRKAVLENLVLKPKVRKNKK